MALAGRYVHTGQDGDPDSDDMIEAETQSAPCLLRYQALWNEMLTQSTHSLVNPADRRRAHNKEVLTFFLPFWYEHILDRQRQDATDAVAEVAGIMGAAPPLPPPPPPQAPLWFPAPPPPYAPPSSAMFILPLPPPQTPSLFPPAWIANDLTPATRADWGSFITKHNLLQPRAMDTECHRQGYVLNR